MLKTLTAHTYEIDDVDLAVAEIKEQLDIENSLLKNSIGLITCYAEFALSGVVSALSEALPFDIVGTTTLGNATNGESSQLMLSLMVLTSDDVEFSASVSSSLLQEQKAALQTAYDEAASRLSSSPKLIISFVSLMFNVGGDLLVRLLDDISGGVPNFGTIAVDHTPDYHDANIIYNGELHKETYVMVLISGNISPSFFISSISEDKILKQKAIITSSEGNILKEVNNTPVLQYMETLGLFQGGNIEGANSIPFILDFNDGTKPIARAIYGLTPEGYCVCGGDMPVGATFGVASIDYEDVMITTTQTLDACLATQEPHGALLFSCISRNMALGMEILAELDLAKSRLSQNIPYQFVYSGGEICPVYSPDGTTVNRFHNDTIVACIF